jgi:hypothetical protein
LTINTKRELTLNVISKNSTLIWKLSKLSLERKARKLNIRKKNFFLERRSSSFLKKYFRMFIEILKKTRLTRLKF